MTVTQPVANGRVPKKQLSDQLDRLDSIIDALAEGLPAAVAAACRDGAQAAIKDAILEIMTNPDLRALLVRTTPQTPSVAAPQAETTTPVRDAKPSVWAKIKARLAAAKAAVVEAAAPTVAVVAGAWTAFVATARTLTEIMPVRRIMMVGVGIGATVAVVSYAAPHGLSAVLTGVGGAATAVAVQVGAWGRRSARMLGFQTS